MSYSLREFEKYLLKNDPKKFKNELGVKGYFKKLHELEGDKPTVSKATDTSKLSSTTPKVSVEADTPDKPNPDNLFYTNGGGRGTMETNQGLFGWKDNGGNSGAGAGTQSHGNTTYTPGAHGGDITNPVSGSNSDPYAIPNTNAQEIKNKIRNLERQQNNYFNETGGYVTTDNLPTLSGYWEKIDALRGQLEQLSDAAGTKPAPPKSSLEELAEVYADSVVNNTGDNDAWNAMVPVMDGPIPEYSQPESMTPFVPEMTEPIQRYSQPDTPATNSDQYAIQDNRKARYANPYDIPRDYNPNDYIYPEEQPGAQSGADESAHGRESNRLNKLDAMIAQRQNENGIAQDGAPGRESNKVNKLDAMIAQRQNENGIAQDGATQDAGAVQNTDTDSQGNGGMPRDERMLFSAQGGLPLNVGMDDEYPPEPNPSPLPGPPPVPDDHPDMEDYEEEVGQYWDEHDAWEDEVACIDSAEEKAVFISEADYTKKLEELERKLEIRSSFVDKYGALIDSTSLNVSNYGLYVKGYNRNLQKIEELKNEINELKQDRAESAKADPLFNTTGLISNQNTLGNMPYGSQGTSAGNSCGAVAAHNALVLLGENSNFTDVYTHFNNDNKLNLGGVAGGKLGTNPFAVAEYLESKGHEVSFKDFKTEELEEPGVYILVYVWQGESGNISAHFKAVESDGSTVKTYNSDKTYFIGNTNNSGDNNAKNIEELKNNSDMLETEKSWVLNVLTGPETALVMGLTDDDTYLSYIIAVE